MNYIALFFSLLFYAVFFSGLIITFSNSFLNLYGWLSLRRRLQNKRRSESENKIFAFLSLLVFSATGKERKGKLLFALLVILFSLCFAVTFIYFKFAVSVFIALVAASVPVLSLVSKITKVRNGSSKEGLSFLSEFYRSYRIENRNIYSAMELTIKNDSDYPVCAKQLYLLLLRLRSAGSKSVVRKDCNDFAFALGSVWGKTLASCIAAACGGTDISEALADIIEQLKLAKESEEERKRLNSESIRMTLFLVPALYIGSFFMAKKSLGIPLRSLLSNQFLTPEGFFMFMAIVLLFFVNILILNFVTEEKLDI